MPQGPPRRRRPQRVRAVGLLLRAKLLGHPIVLSLTVLGCHGPLHPSTDHSWNGDFPAHKCMRASLASIPVRRGRCRDGEVPWCASMDVFDRAGLAGLSAAERAAAELEEFARASHANIDPNAPPALKSSPSVSGDDHGVFPDLLEIWPWELHSVSGRICIPQHCTKQTLRSFWQLKALGCYSISSPLSHKREYVFAGPSAFSDVAVQGIEIRMTLWTSQRGRQSPLAGWTLIWKRTQTPMKSARCGLRTILSIQVTITHFCMTPKRLLREYSHLR